MVLGAMSGYLPFQVCAVGIFYSYQIDRAWGYFGLRYSTRSSYTIDGERRESLGTMLFRTNRKKRLSKQQ